MDGNFEMEYNFFCKTYKTSPNQIIQVACKFDYYYVLLNIFLLPLDIFEATFYYHWITLCIRMGIKVFIYIYFLFLTCQTSSKVNLNPQSVESNMAFKKWKLCRYIVYIYNLLILAVGFFGFVLVNFVVNIKLEQKSQLIITMPNLENILRNPKYEALWWFMFVQVLVITYHSLKIGRSACIAFEHLNLSMHTSECFREDFQGDSREEGDFGTEEGKRSYREKKGESEDQMMYDIEHGSSLPAALM